jgi:hypothetical protein
MTIEQVTEETTMDEYVKNSLCKLLNTLEQAEETTCRSGKYSELIALTRAHLDAIKSVENIYVPEKENNNG